MKDYKEYMNKITEKLKRLKDGKFGKIWRVLTSAVFITMLVVNSAIWCKEGCRKSPKTAYAEELSGVTYRFRTWQSNAYYTESMRYDVGNISDTLTFNLVYAQQPALANSVRFSFNIRRSYIDNQGAPRTWQGNHVISDSGLDRYQISGYGSSYGSSFVIFINIPSNDGYSQLTPQSLYVHRTIADSKEMLRLYDGVLQIEDNPDYKAYVIEYLYTFVLGKTDGTTEALPLTVSVNFLQFIPNTTLSLGSDLEGLNYYNNPDQIDEDIIRRTWYDIGKDEGFQSGYQKGKQETQQTAYDKGKEEGFQQGANVALKDVSPTTALGTFVSGLFEIELLPNVKLSFVVSIAIGCVLLGVVIKMFLGG